MIKLNPFTGQFDISGGGDLGPIQAEIDALTDRVDTLESDVSALDTRVTTIEDNLDNLAYAQVVYVDKSNTNIYTPDGSILKPFKSLNEMYTAITDAGDLKRYACIIAPGTYTEVNTIRLKPFIDLTSLAGDTVIITTSDASTLKLSNDPGGRVYISNLALNSGIEVLNDIPTGTGVILDLDNVDSLSLLFNGRGGGSDFLQLRNDTRIATTCTINSAGTAIFDSTIIGDLTLTDVGCTIPDGFGSAITATLRSNYLSNIIINSTNYDVYVDSWGNNKPPSLTITSNSAVSSTFNTDASSYPSSVTLMGSPAPSINTTTTANTISVEPTGNLAADDVQEALEELQDDIDTRALDSTVIKKDGSVAFTADQSMGGFTLTNLADPTLAQDAATKAYVDSAATGVTEGNGIDITSSVVSVDHDGEGLTFVAAQLALELDGTTLSKSASGLKLNDTAVTPGTFGSATETVTITVDQQGRLTAVSEQNIAIPASQVTDFNEAAQDAVGTILTDSNTIDFTYTDATPSIVADVKTQLSITSDSSGIKLVNDASTPGNKYYYGTDAAGVKGYHVVGSVGDIAETSFPIATDTSSPADVTGFLFDPGIVRSFIALVSVEVDVTSDLFEQFTLQGINKNGSFNMSVDSVGDTSGIVFSITSAGQVQYTSLDYPGFVDGFIKFRAIVTSI